MFGTEFSGVLYTVVRNVGLQPLTLQCLPRAEVPASLVGVKSVGFLRTLQSFIPLIFSHFITRAPLFCGRMSRVMFN